MTAHQGQGEMPRLEKPGKPLKPCGSHFERDVAARPPRRSYNRRLMQSAARLQAPEHAPSLLAPLTSRSLRWALGGRFFALTGAAAQSVTLALLVLDATGLPSGWGTILTVQAIPQ